jgi:hypothetical protein
MLSRPLVNTAWHVLGRRIEETASRCGAKGKAVLVLN